MKISRNSLGITIGLAFIISGLLLTLVNGDDNNAEPHDPIANIEAIVEFHDQEVDEEEEAADIETTVSQPSELDIIRDSIDWSDAPEPRPELVEREDFDLYVNVTGEYLLYVFEKLGYTGDKIDSGETTAIPPLMVVSIPKGWADDQTVQFKKSMFYRVILPLILYENDAVLQERSILLDLRKKVLGSAPMKEKELEWLRNLAIKYQVIKSDDPGEIGAAELDELLLRVDMIPASMALGQAAYESGYATSRFAHTGNALFGQWDWGKDAIKPLEQRGGKGDYGIKAFEYPIDSVRAYLWNLNTHRTYADFRALRAEQRGDRTGQIHLDGIALAGTLIYYSERREEYTQELQGMMRHNRLELADRVRLIEGDPIFFD
jgi:uncharacterized FlgJ-related protein